MNMNMMHESNGIAHMPQELETFLSPEERRRGRVVSKLSLGKDAEAAEFDPFSERKLDNPTSANDTQTHLLKASLGTGILAMPLAFKCAGLLNGVLFTILVAIICTHCAHVLIKCAHVLYKRTKRTQMSFAEIGEAALETGPKCLRRCGGVFGTFIRISLFTTYFGTCSVYTVLIAGNIQPVVEYYTGTSTESRLYILSLLLPLIVMAWIRNLKYLAPVSTVANICMVVGLGITIYYLVGTGELKTDEMKNMLFKPVQEWPAFFSLSIFAIEAIGVVMPLENAMMEPRAMLGIFGVLSRSMTVVTFIYMTLGFLGYLRFGEDVHDSVTLDLDDTKVPAQIVKISIAIAVFCTFGLQFYVCIEIFWDSFKDNFSKRPDLANYVVRTILVTLCVSLAVAAPTIGPFMGVIGAFCFSILGLIAPAFIEIITYWDIGYGPFKYLIWKNIFVFIFGIFALIFGTKEAIIGIMKVYSA